MLGAASPPVLPKAGWDAPRVGGEVVPGKLIRRVTPTYPLDARKMKIEGAVNLIATISEEGKVEDVKVEGGNEFLTAPAIAAVRQWRYTPFTLNGEPIKATTRITINFHR
jgi:protein TonB